MPSLYLFCILTVFSDVVQVEPPSFFRRASTATTSVATAAEPTVEESDEDPPDSPALLAPCQTPPAPVGRPFVWPMAAARQHPATFLSAASQLPASQQLQDQQQRSRGGTPQGLSAALKAQAADYTGVTPLREAVRVRDPTASAAQESGESDGEDEPLPSNFARFTCGRMTSAASSQTPGESSSIQVLNSYSDHSLIQLKRKHSFESLPTLYSPIISEQ